ncbi:MAG: SelB C-terminal domain-containing protein, partial [Acidobacteriota bacterium]
VAVRDLLSRVYREAGYRPESLAEIASGSKRDPKLLERIQRLLLQEGTLVKIADGLIFHRQVLDELKEAVRRQKQKSERIDVTFFKQMAGVTRKYAIPLLEWLDRERVTRRAGNERVIL